MVESKLDVAKQVGADVVINSQSCDINSIGLLLPPQYITYEVCLVMKETSGNGVGRIIEATGSAQLAGSCFTCLR